MCERERVIKIDLQNALIDPMKSVKGLSKTDDFYCSYLVFHMTALPLSLLFQALGGTISVNSIF
jgi:hypothetical protein